MDSQRAAGQGEAKAQQNPQPQAPPELVRLGAPYCHLCACTYPVKYSVYTLVETMSLITCLMCHSTYQPYPMPLWFKQPELVAFSAFNTLY